MAHDQATLDDLLVHAEWMRGLARRLLGDRDEADDVVQAAWLSALRVPPARGRTLRPWIATVVLNLIRSRARREVRTRAREELLASPDPAPTAEEMLAQRQTERLLAQLVLALEDPYRRTILLRFHDGQSSAAIAREEGIPEGTVRWRLKYGLDELRRRFVEAEVGGKSALWALIPVAGPPVSPAPVPAASPWLWRATLGQSKAVLTATGAAAALAVVAAGAGHRPHEARSLGPAAQVSTAPTRRTAYAPLPVPGLSPLLDDLDLPQPEGAQAASTVAPPPAVLTAITGVVRDSRGEAAAGVPVTLRRLVGGGAADRTTITDEAGRFSYQLQSRSSFVLTAELQGEPAPRLQIEVPTASTIRLHAGPSLTAQAPSFATIDIALDSGARAISARAPKAARHAPGTPLSRWCCHQAFAVGDVVYGRACLKFDDSHRSEQSGCELYGLKTQVSCHHRIHGGLSTGDLSRTERLDCDGRLF